MVSGGQNNVFWLDSIKVKILNHKIMQLDMRLTLLSVLPHMPAWGISEPLDSLWHYLHNAPEVFIWIQKYLLDPGIACTLWPHDAVPGETWGPEDLTICLRISFLYLAEV